MSDVSGNFGMLTAFALVPLVGAAGMAIDYGRALNVRHELMGAADAAALGAVSAGSAGFKAIQQMRQDGKVTVAQEEGRKLFLSQRSVATVDNVASLPLQVTVDVERNGGAITSAVSFTAHMPTTFMAMFGKQHVKISGSATAAYGAQEKTYTDFYMLLDNSPSMGIAATTSEIKRMKELTGANGERSCAFACHVGRWNQNGSFTDSNDRTYVIARDKKNNIRLRIDVVAQAAKALITKITEIARTNEQYRVATYSFGKSALQSGYRIEKVASLSLDMTSVGNATEKVDLMTTNHDWYNHNALTSFDVALTEIGKEIGGEGGGGTSAADAEKVVYFVTDGMADHKPAGKCSGSPEGDSGRCLEPINTSYCQALKDRNIKIAILYTTYVPLDGDGTWDGLIRNKFADKIAPALKQCASPDLFFEVKPDDDMEAAMVKLFVNVTGAGKGLRLTN
jgi:hypothetical protein